MKKGIALEVLVFLLALVITGASVHGFSKGFYSPTYEKALACAENPTLEKLSDTIIAKKMGDLPATRAEAEKIIKSAKLPKADADAWLEAYDFVTSQPEGRNEGIAWIVDCLNHKR